MRNGDLSNEVVPRLVLVFEGALGFMPTEDWQKFDRSIRRKRWDDAAALWQINPLMAVRLWDITMRLSFTVDIVTFAGPEPFGEALEYRLQDVEDLPVGRAWATRPGLLARKIAYMPDLFRVYDPDPTRVLTWGGKGRIITRADEVGL